MNKVKKSAILKLKKEGAFSEAEAEYQKQVAAAGEHKPITPEEKREREAAQTEWQQKVKTIAHEKGVDNFSGAWKSISSSAKVKSAAFAAGAGVLMGAITRYVTTPNKNRSGGDAGDYYSTDGGGYWSSHHGHDGRFDGGFS